MGSRLLGGDIKLEQSEALHLAGAVMMAQLATSSWIQVQTGMTAAWHAPPKFIALYKHAPHVPASPRSTVSLPHGYTVALQTRH